MGIIMQKYKNFATFKIIPFFISKFLNDSLKNRNLQRFDRKMLNTLFILNKCENVIIFILYLSGLIFANNTNVFDGTFSFNTTIILRISFRSSFHFYLLKNIFRENRRIQN